MAVESWNTQSACHVNDPLDDNEWHFVAVTLKNKLLTTYIDGVGSTDSFDVKCGSIQDVSIPMIIGYNQNSVGEYWYKGTIDDIKIYNCALSEEDIAELYHEGGWPIEEECEILADYPFNGNANDESSNGFNGNVHGATPTEDRFGIQNGAYEFDGSDYIDIPNGVNLNFDQEMSITSWMYISQHNPTDVHVVGNWSQGNIPGNGEAGFTLAFLGQNTNDQGLYFLCADDIDHPNGTWAACIIPIGEIPLNEWFQVVGTRNSINTKIYLNGVLKDVNSAGTPNINNPNQILIMGAQSTGLAKSYKGKLDEIKIYNCAISEDQISDLYHEGGWPIEEPCEYTYHDIAFMQDEHQAGAVISYDNKVFVISGYDLGPGPNDRNRTTEVYDPSNDSWTVMANSLLPVQSAGCFELLGNIYIVGGETNPSGRFTNAVQKYTIGNDSWSYAASFPRYTTNGCLSLALNDEGYIMGGVQGYSGTYADVYKYDPQVNSWTKKANMLTSVLSAGIISYNGKIYVFGGDNRPNRPTQIFIRKVQIYDPNSDTWEYGEDMPVTLLNIQAVRYNNSVLLFSSHYVDDVTGEFIRHKKIYKYSFESGEWDQYCFDPPYQTQYGNKIGVVGNEAFFTDIWYDNNRSKVAYKINLGEVFNTPPIADAGEDQNITCAHLVGIDVVLDGSGSSDPDGDSLAYVWEIGDSVIGNGVNPTIFFAPGEYVVTLTVADFEYTDTDEVTITVETDLVAPEITLNGDNPLNLYRFGDPYSDPGADVSDDCDENPTLTISGSVDILLPGSYMVTYEASDFNGNTTEVTRVVNVLDDPAYLTNPYLFLSEKKVKLDKLGQVTGDIHSNEEIDIKKGPVTYYSDITALDKIDIAKDITIDGDVRAGGELQLDKNVVITGVAEEYANVDYVELVELNFNTGGDDIKVKKKKTLALLPDSYGKVEVEKEATLKLSTGEYFIEELKVKKEVVLEFEVTNGPITLNVEKKIDLDQKLEVMILPLGVDDSRYVILNSMEDIVVDKESMLLGSLNAPYGKVQFKQDIEFYGSVSAEEIDVDKKVDAVYHSDNNDQILAKGANQLANSVELVEEVELPTSYALKQNYPNPFNPSTTISYSIPKDGHVVLRLYDVLGNEVTKLEDGYKSAGNYRHQFDASRLTSGIYFYSIRSGKFVDTKKMLLMK